MRLIFAATAVAVAIAESAEKRVVRTQLGDLEGCVRSSTTESPDLAIYRRRQYSPLIHPTFVTAPPSLPQVMRRRFVPLCWDPLRRGARRASALEAASGRHDRMGRYSRRQPVGFELPPANLRRIRERHGDWRRGLPLSQRLRASRMPCCGERERGYFF
jgi:hypothetical protein